MYKNIKIAKCSLPPRSLNTLMLQGDVFLRLHVFMVHLKFLGNVNLHGSGYQIYSC